MLGEASVLQGSGDCVGQQSLRGTETKGNTRVEREGRRGEPLLLIWRAAEEAVALYDTEGRSFPSSPKLCCVCSEIAHTYEHA